MTRGQLIRRVINTVCNHFLVTVDDLGSKSRKRERTLARQTAMYVLYHSGFFSLAEIGKLFNRDHSTVIHARELIDDILNYKQTSKEKASIIMVDRICKNFMPSRIDSSRVPIIDFEDDIDEECDEIIMDVYKLEDIHELILTDKVTDEVVV